MINLKQLELREEAFRDLCRRHGLKATHQRSVTFRELASTDEHPDVEILYLRVRRKIPSISLDTVYRTLRLLEKKGVICRVAFVADRMRYDAETGRHHHFVCNACGRVMDFSSATLDRVPPPPEKTDLGRIESMHIELRGLCNSCRSKNRNRA
ncbi:MAG: Fur family transcriptional regulator [Kiritimatiellia bacterium]